MKRISFVLAAALIIAPLCAAQTSSTDLSNFRQEGIASWYGTEFNGRPTASGEVFNSSLYTAAHPTLPFGTLLTVTNLNNGRKVNIRVNDRGPFVSSRIIDLSLAAAQMLDMVTAGTAPVLLEAQAYSPAADSPYWAETNSYAWSEGGNSSADSQITAPPYPVYPNNPYQAQEPVVVQAQPPQQQITQYFHQPPQPAPQQPAQPAPAPGQQPGYPQQSQQVQQLPPMQQVQPVQQVLPVQQVQQVVQPMRPLVQPVIVPQTVPQQIPPPQSAPAVQLPAAPLPPSPANPSQAVQPQTAPLQIQIPIEVRPVVSAGSPAPAVAVPVQAAVKPNAIYRIQVGSFKEARNALAAFERLKGVGLNPVYERNGEYFRVVISGIPAAEMTGVLQKIQTLGFNDPLLREER